MLRQLQKVGNSKGVVLNRTMLDHLGVEMVDGRAQVEVTMEKDAIVIRPAKAGLAVVRPRRHQPFEEAMDATFKQYDGAMKRLAE